MMSLVFSHLSFGESSATELGAVRRFAGDAIDLTRVFYQTLTQLVDFAKVGAHAFVSIISRLMFTMCACRM